MQTLLSYNNKNDYLKYLNSLNNESINNEYWLNYNLYNELKHYYNYFKSQIIVNVIHKAHKALKNNKNMECKRVILTSLNKLKEYNEILSNYIEEIDSFNNINESHTSNNENIETLDVIDFFDEIDIYYHALNELNILIENNLNIMFYYLFGIGEIKEENKDYPSIILGNKLPNNKWDYVSCLEMLISSIYSWFECIECQLI